MGFGHFEDMHTFIIKIVKATLALLLFLFPALCVFLFLLFSLDKDFIASSRLKPFSDIAAAVGASVYALTIAALLYRDPKARLPSGKHKRIAAHAGLILFAPFLGWGLTHGFISGPLSYGLHKAQAVVPVTLEVDVAGIGMRRGLSCWRQALLSDARFVWKQKVCLRDDEQAQNLHAGGRLRLFGKSTDYGTEVTRYEVIRYAQPGSFLNHPRPTDSTRRLSDFVPQQNK